MALLFKTCITTFTFQENQSNNLFILKKTIVNNHFSFQKTINIMKTTTVIFALFFSFSLNGIAQKSSYATKHFAAYQTPNVASDNVHSDKENLFLSGRDLEIAENKARKSFAELTNLGEGFWVESQPFQAATEAVADSSSVFTIRVNAYKNAFFLAQWTAFSRLLEQEPIFFKK
jgi:hypothetical protein